MKNLILAAIMFMAVLICNAQMIDHAVMGVVDNPQINGSMPLSANMDRTVGKYSAKDFYLKYTPTHYKIKGSILMMCGSGEIGTDSSSLSKLENVELGKLFKQGLEVPYVVYIPLLQAQNWPSDGITRMLCIIDADAAIAALPHHITGLSLGANGVHTGIGAGYALKGNKPGYFKTAVPIASGMGYGSVKIEWYKGLKIKLYHNTTDPTVPIPNDIKMEAFLKAGGVDVEHTWYPVSGHNSWTAAYKEYFPYLELVDGKAELLEQETKPAITININGIDYPVKY